jgi:hypothetical protein
MTNEPTTPIAYTFTSRYGALRSLSPLGRGSDGLNHYIVEGDSRYIRGADGMVDFEGGPFIAAARFCEVEGMGEPTLAEAIGSFPCFSPSEIVVDVQWLEGSNAAHALGIVPTQRNDYAYALVKTRTP